MIQVTQQVERISSWEELVAQARAIVFDCLDDNSFSPDDIRLRTNLVLELGADETIDLHLDLPYRLRNKLPGIDCLRPPEIFPKLDEIAAAAGDAANRDDTLTGAQIAVLKERFPDNITVQQLQPAHSKIVDCFTFEHVCLVLAAKLNVSCV